MDEPQWLTDRELRTWEAFLVASTVVGRLVEQQLKEDSGLSHPQYEVLARLSAAPQGRLRMTDLAMAALTSKSGLTYQVAQLEKAGFVKREGCRSDVRGVVAILTEKGWDKLRSAAPGHARLVRGLLVDGMDEQSFEALSTGLTALVNHLSGAP